MGREQYKVSIDIGGTFTDVVAMRESDGQIQVIKVSSTPDDPSRAFLQGVRELSARLGILPSDISCLIHGSTVGCNAVVQGRLPKTALVTTEGFRDVLELARMIRPVSYDLHFSKARLLVPRHLRFEAAERIGADGEVVRALTEEALQRIVDQVRDSGAEAVAVSCLFSFLNPQHERAIGEALRKGIPGCRVCLSCEVNPIFREYERTCVTVLNAALIGVMSDYLEKIHVGLRALGCTAPLYIMRQDGGYMGSGAAQAIPVQALVSGPTGGALMANYLGRLTENPNVVSLDVGGTTADVCITAKGKIQTADVLQAGGYPLSIRSIEVNAVGAGGGSIAWRDKGGFLHVGPDSAGSNPGPIAYGLGGKDLTLTDANLVLGRLDADSLLNGGMTLNAGLSGQAAGRLAAEVGMPLEELAEGIVKIAVANMAKGIRVLSVERGLDLRDFTLVPFGGGGPMYASEIARELGIPQVLIPPHPGAGSAFGLLTSDLRHVASRSCVAAVGEADADWIAEIGAELTGSVLRAMEEEGHGAQEVDVSAAADFRYRGQSYEIPVPVSLPVTADSLNQAAEQYHRAYALRYGHCNANSAVELVNLHIAGIASIGRAEIKRAQPGTGAEQAVSGLRSVIFHGRKYDTKIYRRDLLGSGDVVRGPAIISEYDSTTILWPNDLMCIDGFGNMVISFPDPA